MLGIWMQQSDIDDDSWQLAPDLLLLIITQSWLMTSLWFDPNFLDYLLLLRLVGIFWDFICEKKNCKNIENLYFLQTSRN